MSFVLPYMTNRKRAANLMDSDDEDSVTSMQNANSDIEASQMSENNNQISVNEHVSSVNDEDKDMVEAEDAVECVQNMSSPSVNTVFKKKKIIMT